MSSTSNKFPDLIGIKDVADIFDVTPQTVYNWTSRGILPTVNRVGRPIRFKRSDIMEFFNTNDPASD